MDLADQIFKNVLSLMTSRGPFSGWRIKCSSRKVDEEISQFNGWFLAAGNNFLVGL